MKGAECSFQHDKKPGACVNCGSTGHGMKKCTRPKGQRGDKGAKDKGAEPRAAAAAQGSSETIHAQIIQKSPGQLGLDWVLLDSGATHFVRKLRKRGIHSEGCTACAPEARRRISERLDCGS